MEKEEPLAKGVWSRLQGWIWSSLEQSTIAPPMSVELQMLNDDVFEVWKPSGDNYGGDSLSKVATSAPSVEIVFFHGLQLEKTNRPHVTTWLSRDKSEFWLNWLQDEFPAARILTISYDAAFKKTDTEGRMDMFKVAENLVTSLTGPSAHVGQTECPVVLVGHCLGGLVMKEVCDQANGMVGRGSDGDHQHLDNFLRSVKGFFYYSTPHLGVPLPHSGWSKTGSLVEELRILNAQTARRNERFRGLRQKFGWKNAAVGGNYNVNLKKFGGFPFDVSEASTRYEIDAAGYYTVAANHFDVCRPVGKKCASFLRLCEFLDKCLAMQLDSSPEWPDFTVGLDGRISEVLQVLQIEADTIQPGVKGILLYGIGGIGKTTLGGAVCSRIPIRGRDVAQVEIGERNSIIDVQMEIYKKLSGKEAKVASVRDGREKLQGLFLKRKSPIVLFIDNVYRPEELEDLLPSNLNLPDKSRVIITSRDKTATKFMNGSMVCKVFPVKKLEASDCEVLFLKHLGPCPDERKEQFQAVLEACGGFPFAIRLVGRLLKYEDLKEDSEAWDSIVTDLKSCQLNDGGSEEQLRVIPKWSYERLSIAAKRLFLDISCLLRDVAWDFIEALGNPLEVKRLLDFSLIEKVEVKRSGSFEVQVHDLLAAMGRSELSENPDLSSRTRLLLDTDEKFQEFLREDSKGCQGLVVNGPISKHCISAEKIDSMLETLRILVLARGISVMTERNEIAADVNFVSRANEHLPFLLPNANRLRVGDKQCPVLNFSNATQLRILSIYPGNNTLQLLRVRQRKRAALMKTFLSGNNLNHYFWTKHMRDMNLMEKMIHNVKSLTNRYLLSKSLVFCKLYSQDTLHLDAIEKCTSLRTLAVPNFEEIFPCLTGLKKFRSLTLENCLQLEKLPDNFGGMSALVELWLGNCNRLKRLPDSFCNLLNLANLSLLGCQQLQELPNNFGNLSALKRLSLQRCKQLRSLPNNFANLSHLAKLSLGKCEQLQELPDNFGRLVALVELWLDGCKQLKRLPDSFASLPNLAELSLSDCEQLKVLPNNFGKLSTLVTLDLDGCKQLQELPNSFGNLLALAELCLDGCGELKRLPDSFANLSNLAELSLSDCEQLELPDNFGKLLALVKIDLDRCEQLKRLPDDFTNLSNLVELSLWGCEQLEVLPNNFGKLSALAKLDLVGCKHLKRLSNDFGDLLGLAELSLSRCEELEELPSNFGELSALKELSLQGCRQLKRLPDSFADLSNLAELSLSECKQLEVLPDNFGNLSTLAKLSLQGCEQLPELPNSCAKLSALVGLRLSDASS